MGLVGHLGIHKGVYLVFRDITPVHAFGRVDISCKGIEWQTTVIPRYRNDVFQYNHIAPYRIGAAFLHRAQEILEVVDEREVQLFEGNILTLVCMGQELPNMLADGYVSLESPFGSAVSDFLCKLSIVLLKEFQQGFLLNTDAEIDIFQLGGCNIPIRLHQFLVAAVYLHPNLVNCTVDFLRLGTFARSSVVLHIPQVWGNVHLAAELFNLSAHRKAAHQWQVAVGLYTAFLHVE